MGNCGASISLGETTIHLSFSTSSNSMQQGNRKKQARRSLFKNSVVTPASTKDLTALPTAGATSCRGPNGIREVVVHRRRSSVASVVSGLTMEDGLAMLSRFPSRKSSFNFGELRFSNTFPDTELHEEEEVRLLQEMILSYINTMDETSEKMGQLLVQVNSLLDETKADTHPLHPRPRRSVMVNTIKEEFRIQTQINDQCRNVELC